MAGCGPCGLSSPLFLAERGHRVTMFERFDAPSPIGSGLMIQPTGMAVLANLGLAERIAAEGSRIDRLFGTAGSKDVLGAIRIAASRPSSLPLLQTPLRKGFGRLVGPAQQATEDAKLRQSLHEAIRSAGEQLSDFESIESASSPHIENPQGVPRP